MPDSAYILAPLKNVKLPPKIKKHGRPKGAEKTVIGLPKKKKQNRNQPVPFLKKHPTDKERDWFILLIMCHE